MQDIKRCANQTCGIPFKPGKPWARYCSFRCAGTVRKRRWRRRVKARRVRLEEQGFTGTRSSGS
jgi:hypothetical protein